MRRRLLELTLAIIFAVVLTLSEGWFRNNFEVKIAFSYISIFSYAMGIIMGSVIFIRK